MTALRALLFLIFPLSVLAETEGSPLWWRDNLDAWCIVPFDVKQRTPAQRAEMVVKLGLKRVAYDWREKHVPEFEEEILQYQKHGVEFFAFWDVHPKAFELFAKYKLHPQVWLMAPNPQAATNDEKIKLAATALLPAVEQTRKIGSKLALYNHGGWNGEPENMVGIVEYLRKHHDGGHVGIVYNFHHGHAHIETFAAKWKTMQPCLLAVNLNGMESGGDAKGRKILHLGEGDRELEMMRVIEQSGWRGPVGIIDHREETDSEVTLRNNLLGLDWLRKELVKPGSGGARPVYAAAAKPVPVTTELAEGRFGKALNAARAGLLVPGNDAWRTAPFTVEAWAKLRTSAGFNVIVASDTKASPRHWELYSYAGTGDFAVYLPGQGGEVRGGTKICDNAWHHLAMVLEPLRVRLFVDGKQVLEKALPAVTAAAVPGELGIGRTVEPGIGCDGLVDDVRISRGTRNIKVPEAALSRDDATIGLFPCEELPKTTAAELPERAPLVPSAHPLHTHPVNRDRIYDFYEKQARDWRSNPRALLPQYPGLDGGTLGHWGNQNEDYWRDGRWNQMDCGPCVAGVFHGNGLTVPKAVCVKLGGNGERAACYDPVADEWRVLWQGGFLKFTDTRHGLMDGLLMNGQPLNDKLTDPVPRRKAPLNYRGYYRHGNRTVFTFDLNGEEQLKSADYANGEVRQEYGESLRALTKGGPAQWPKVLETAGTSGQPVPGWPYVVDTLTLPFDNPWRTLFFIGGHDFFSNGDLALCTMTGDVWRVSGVDASLARLRWKRLAAGLHQPLGLVVVEDRVCVMGRDQITRLHDLNGDGETDFYECLTNDFTTPTGGHDYICGLERDAAGSFYTASGKDGLLRLKPGKKPEVLASGFRNPAGLGLSPDGTLTIPYSEGDWTPASAVAQITKGGYYGYPGPRAGTKTLPPLLYLPRGVDNSSGGQTWVPDNRWGPLKGRMIHLSYGAGTHHLVLRQEVNGVWQGAAVSLPGDFNSGVHRGRFNPHDGQLYVSGMTGWGTYTPDDGCLHRVRYTGGPSHLPVAFAAHDNGVLLTFSETLDASATETARHFAQCWNYRYSQAYGSQEYSLRQPDTAGHDVLTIISAHLLDNGRQLFLEIPQWQPAGQIHLVVQPQPGVSRELFLTTHQLASPFTSFPGYTVIAKLSPGTAAAAVATEPLPVKWERGEPGRVLTLQTAPGMQFAQKELRAKTGERLSLTLENPDPLPHNWVLLQPGSIEQIGELSNQLVTAPDAAARHYVPDSPRILCHTRLLNASQNTIIHFTAPAAPGRYPYLCTFPGHWMLMRGELIVE